MAGAPSSLEMSWDDNLILETQPSSLIENQPALKDGGLPTAPYQQSDLTFPSTRIDIINTLGAPENTACQLCQQQLTTYGRLRVHVVQHFTTTFCPCGEFSYNRDYVLRNRRTMKCHLGHFSEVDAAMSEDFF